MYSIPDLETFVAVARSGGVLSAARRLGISAATTSHRIAKLEQVLNVTLFHRNSRRLQPTDEGQMFLERIEPMLADLRHAEDEIGRGTAPLRGHLRVTMSPWILSRFIMPKLAAFRDAHPDLTIDFLAVDRMVPLVEEGQDCAIRVGQLEDSALVARKLSDNNRVICAAPEFLGRNGTPDTIGELACGHWVCLPWQTRIGMTDTAGRRAPFVPERRIEVSNSDILTDAAVQGLGFAIKSKLAIQAELDAGTLVEVLPGRVHAPEAPIWFVFSPEARSGRKTKAFGDLAGRAFAQVD